MPDQAANLKQLGEKVGIPASPDQAVLETIPTVIQNCVVSFSIPEFTSLCPKTGQPDFARFYIDFIPNVLLVESKSLKLFMHSYRNHGAFHETVTYEIADRLDKLLSPKWIRVLGIWFPRGGIPIDVEYERGDPGEQRIPVREYPIFMGR